MADRIKGITIELNGDATGLDKALKGVNKEINDTWDCIDRIVEGYWVR